MDNVYPVTFCGKQTGKVIVNRKGLYYYFHCRCLLSDEKIYRLTVTCGKLQENLGILIPQNGIFVLDTKLAVKKIGEGEMSFTLKLKQEKFSEMFVPICPEEPFAYISRLKESFLMVRDGQPGICIAKKQEY